MAAVGCLPNGNVVVWLQTALYFAAAILGFFICIPLGILLRNFQGSCILFAQILDWRPAVIWPWSETSCDFILYFNLAVNIFYATFMGCATLLIAYKCDKKYAHKIGNMKGWHIAYVLTALNPVFLIVNILIAILELCSAAIVIAGTEEFCNNILRFLGTKTTPGLSSTTTSMQTTTTPMPCNIVQSFFDPDLNETVTYTVNPCTTTPLTIAASAISGSVSSCSELQSWDMWWDNMRIIRGRTRGLDGSNFYGCLILICVASCLVLVVWVTQLALNVGMMMRVCTCDVAEEKRKDDRTMLIAQRRSRLATPSVTPGGGPGRHTPQTFTQPMGPGQPAQGPPRQYASPPPTDKDAGFRSPPEKYPEKVPMSDSDVTDTSGAAAPPPPQHILPPPQRRMEPSPRRPVDEGPVVVEAAAAPPAYHQLPPPTVRSPPSRLV